VADDPLAQRRLADAQWVLDAAASRLHADVAEMWAMAEAGTTPTMADRARWRWHTNRSCELTGDAVVDLFRAATGRAIFLDHPLQGRFQDVQAALAHAFLVPDSPARAVGGDALGASRPEIVL
jgi:3-hydroxy-9,10-secoandrosta-1,3,5(10)-triene-9,17-dione monooxygenase